MKRIVTGVLFGVLSLVVFLPASAQSGGTEDQSVNLKQIRQLRRQTEKNATLPEDVRSEILKYCDISISALQTAIDNRAAAAAFERERGGIDRQVKALQADLEDPEPLPQLDLPSHPTVSDVQDALARERSRLAANRSALRNLERLAEDRAQSRTDISKRLGQLDLELELLDEELRSLNDSVARTELKNAGKLSVLARKEQALSEVEMLRAKLVLLGDRSILIPLEIDLAQRRVAFSQELVRMLTEAAHDLRTRQIRESLEKVETISRQLSEDVPTLVPLAVETQNLARELWGPDGLIVRSEAIVTALAETRRHQSDLNRIAELTARKFEAFGRGGSITRWWPKIPRGFPKPGVVAQTLQHLNEEIPEMEYRVITWEQQRSAAHDLNRETLLALEDQSENKLDSHLKKRIQQLLSTRQIILDRLIQEGGRYSNQLVEYRRLSDSFLERLHEVEHFLFAHVLWYRSVPRPIIPRLSDLGGAAGWLLSPERLNAASIVGYVFRGDGLFAALFLIAIVLLRQRMMRRLKDIGEHISVPGRDGFRFTLEAVMITFLLAVPLPIFFAIAGTIVGRIGDSTYFFSLAAALSKLVIVAFLFELIRQIFADRGLAEAHFGWPAHATQPLHRGLLISEGIGLPLLLIALHLGFAGFRLDSPDQLQVFSNSLGRVAFIAALVIFGVSILTMLKPEKTLSPSDQEMRVPWPRRFSEYAFPTAFLGAYPIVILATIVPALFAIFGFYITALLLAYQMLRTLLLGVFVLIGGGLFHRWRIVNRNRSLLDEDGLPKEDGPSAEFLASEKQIRQLFRFAVIAALSVGLFGIWNDALPWLQVLKRVQILPRIELLETVEDGEGLAGTTATLAGEKPVASETPENAGKVPGLPVPESGAGEASATVSPPDSPLTVWEILEAMLAAVATLLLVKNLPGVIEIVLMRRTTLDGGARFAFSTLVRYSITIVGAIAVFGLLGVTWGKVQWLAAALTFGLGFGLQEIVANFVSGLILLVERPVRVGDVVTIGTLMGRVSRIQIRATTIILWDRSEMIVPNKEFITTKLVNWTLSDSKRRIEIPLRVEYGTDLDVVRTTLVEIAQRHPAVLADPAPHVLLLAFGDDAINFELRFVVDFGKGLSTKDEVQMAIDQAFREKGINFALPRSEIRLITSSSDDRDGTQS